MLKELYEECEALEVEQKKHRMQMIELTKNRLFGYLDEKELNAVIDYLNYSEKLNNSYSNIANSLENHIRVVESYNIDKVCENALKHDSELSKELNKTYKDTTIKSYIDGLITSIRSDQKP